MSLSFEGASSLIKGVGHVSDEVVALACKLFESKAVSAVEYDFPLPDDTLVYHLEFLGASSEKAALENEQCALLGNSMPLSNGVVLGEEHHDMRCLRRPCKYSVL